MTTYKTLVVAPTTNLELVSDEVMQVVNTLDAHLLQGNRANLHGLMDTLREQWEIVWFASHGSEQGIQLSDGLLNTAEITSLIRSAGVQLTVLNTCSSYEVAHTIHAELGTQFVATVKPVPDRQAYITGSLFAQQIARGLSFRQAYEAAKPGQNSTYVFLGDREQLMPPNERSPRLEDDLAKIRDDLRRIEAIVSGNQQWNVYGIVPELRDLRHKVDQLLDDFTVMRSAQLFNRRLLIGVSIVSTALLVAVTILIMQWGTP